mmetsp:Transcript_27611/g.55196  ORF Transcript_27611/g.55196 Transcript_27611/m.55196 type:complete len:224 (-) Transcript_27611:29-700(-)
MARLLCALFVLLCATARAIKIVCVGDSITYGSTASDPSKTAYPAWLLQSALAGSNHEVLNYGVSGATMMKEGDKPYWKEPEFDEAMASEADVVLIQLGTNDAKSYQWNEEAYVSAYAEMINGFVTQASGSPKIYISIPPPLYTDGVYEMDQEIINERLPVLLPAIAASNTNVTGVVDVFSAMGGADLSKYELFCNLQSCDECHPNDMGYSLMASVFYKAVFLS